MVTFLVAILFSSPSALASEAFDGRCAAVTNQRELSAAEYEILGRMVWSRMEMHSDPSKRILSADEVNDLIDRMHRSRGELMLDLDTLHKLMRSPTLSTKGDAGGGINIDTLFD